MQNLAKSFFQLTCLVNLFYHKTHTGLNPEPKRRRGGSGRRDARPATEIPSSEIGPPGAPGRPARTKNDAQDGFAAPVEAPRPKGDPMTHDPSGGLSPLRLLAGRACCIEALAKAGSPIRRFAEMAGEASGR